MGHTLKQQTTPTEPPSGYTRFYTKADGKVYRYPNGGSETEIGGIGAHALGGAEHTADTLANLNAKITGATLDDASASRPPLAHGDSAHTGNIGTAAQLELGYLAGATDKTVQDWSNGMQSAGVITGGVISDGGSGTINISEIRGVVKTTNSDIGANVFFLLAAQTGLSLTDNDSNYVAVDYNSGTPQIVIGVSSTSNGHTIFNLGKVYREGTSLDILNSGLRIEDFSKRVQQHHVEKGALEFVDGALVSATGTRNIAISAGVLYAGLNRIVTNAIDTNVADDFEYYYYNGSAWIESDETQIDEINYNNIASGLVALTANRYGVHWVYKGSTDKTYVIYGRGDYTLTDATAAQPPDTLPEHVSEYGVLRAKIIIQKSSSTFYSLENVDDYNFQGVSTLAHNDTTGIQGGGTGDNYHLTQTRHTDLTDGGDSTLHYHAADRARANHSGTQAASTLSDWTAKGDILAATAASTATRLPVGTTNGQALLVDSAQSTGLRWGVVFPVFDYRPIDLEFPISPDWAVNNIAGEGNDSNGIHYRTFDDTTEEGVGFTFTVPLGATNIIIDLKSNASNAPGAARKVGNKLYKQTLGDNVDEGSWSSGFVMNDIDIPTNDYTQYDTQTIALSSLSVTAGQLTKFELTRIAPSAGTNLTDDWEIRGLTVRFS